MHRAGVVGIGDMGGGMARNLIANGFETIGFDIDADRLRAFEKAGGRAARDAAEVGRAADAVYVMVMNGDQAKSVILGDGGLVANMSTGGLVLLTATIRPDEAREIGRAVSGSGVHLVDSPVSGGRPGAEGGTLTLMAAGEEAVLDEYRAVMEAVSGTIHRVGTAAGEGQTVKACLQSLIGAIFTATFEASVLAAKAGVDAEALHAVFSTSAAGCGIANGALANIIDGRFEGTGSRIDTMHKDLTISLDLAERLGVPLHTAATAMQLFTAGRAKYPAGDNQVVTRVLEDIVGVGLRRGENDGASPNGRGSGAS